MALDETIKADLGDALKAKDLARANTLRMLIAAFKNAEIEKRSPLTEDDRLGQVQKAIKMRREGIEGAIKAGRADRQAAEEAEITVLEAYLPAQMSEDELKRVIAATVAEAGARTPAEMGKVMKLLMPKLAGKADGAKASALVKAALAGGG